MWFTVFTAYYDAASKEEATDSPLVVAGFVATEAGWIEFERAWRTALEVC
jgi:hypothetical protein